MNFIAVTRKCKHLRSWNVDWLLPFLADMCNRSCFENFCFKLYKLLKTMFRDAHMDCIGIAICYDKHYFLRNLSMGLYQSIVFSCLNCYNVIGLLMAWWNASTNVIVPVYKIRGPETKNQTKQNNFDQNNRIKSGSEVPLCNRLFF